MSHAIKTDSIQGNHFFAIVRKNPKKVTGVAIGVIVGLGGIFLLLAALKIVPQGVNVISRGGKWGIVGGVIFVGLGGGGVVLSIYLPRQEKQENRKLDGAGKDLKIQSKPIAGNPRSTGKSPQDKRQSPQIAITETKKAYVGELVIE